MRLTGLSWREGWEVTRDDRTGRGAPHWRHGGRRARARVSLAGRPGLPRPLDSGRLALVTLPTSPFWARRYTRMFLDSCRGIGDDTAQTPELPVSELVTNAVRFAGDPARTPRNSGRASVQEPSARAGLAMERDQG